jgi:hypothetical protein
VWSVADNTAGISTGATTNNTLSITGAAQAGSATINLSVTAGGSQVNAAAFTVTVTAGGGGGTDEFWNFSLEPFFYCLPPTRTDTQNFGGVMLLGGSGMAYNANNQSVPGTSFTRRVQFNGTGNLTNRNVSFEVTGPARITVYAITGSTGNARPLILHDGTAEVQSVNVNAMGAYEFNYGGSGGRLYVWSGNSGINIYGIRVTY